jgi:release factor glutamine methyltransferase
MLLGEIKQLYSKSLAPVYPSEEIQSLFEITAVHVLRQTCSQIHSNLSKITSPEAEKKMESILERLKTSEPIQYILGFTSFYDMEIEVGPGVLIPRQETEYLVDLILKENKFRAGLSVIDLCTGSGCIALALSKNLPDARLTATDISPEALKIAAGNAVKHNVKINFILDDLLHPLYLQDKFHVVVCNPPYVRNMERSLMHKNVLNFEPPEALFVDDADPLIFYRSVASFARKYSYPEGRIYVEMNEYLAKEMQDLFEINNFRNIEIIKDLDGKQRYLRCTV